MPLISLSRFTQPGYRSIGFILLRTPCNQEQALSCPAFGTWTDDVWCLAWRFPILHFFVFYCIDENNHISYVNGEPYFQIGPVTSLSVYWIELGVDGNKAGSAGCYFALREGNLSSHMLQSHSDFLLQNARMIFDANAG